MQKTGANEEFCKSPFQNTLPVVEIEKQSLEESGSKLFYVGKMFKIEKEGGETKTGLPLVIFC